MASMVSTRITCTHDCPDACSAIVDVDNTGTAVSIVADDTHPITGRHLCVKVDRYLERVYSPDRLATPLRRTGPKGSGDFEAISWDVALDEIADRWTNIIAESGGEALLGYSYLGSMSVLDAYGPTHAVMNKLGATQLERTICGGQWYALSDATLVPWSEPEHLPDAKVVIVWGMDPVSTSIHTWELIRKARRHGAKLVVVDPYRSRTARYADVHLRPHAGTDGALAMAIAQVIIEEGLHDSEYLASHSTDFEAFRVAVAGWNPERAERETGVAAADIVACARLYAAARPAAIRLGVGMQRSSGAGSAMRAIQCLPALTGQRRWPSGGIIAGHSLRQIDHHNLTRPDLVPAGTREINMNQLGRALTDQAMDPPIRSLFVWNSNPAVITADQNRVRRGLERDDLFTVVHDLFLTDTARYADIVLPATSMIEHADLVGSWGYSYVSWNEAAIDPIGESKSNSELARLLAARLGFDDKLFSMSDHELMALALEGSAAEAGGGTVDAVRSRGFVRVGPLPKTAPDPKHVFAFDEPRLAEAGVHPVVEYVPPQERPLAGSQKLRLLTLKRHYSINTSYANLPIMQNAEPLALVEIHPDDAASRGLASGDAVDVYNDLGRIELVVDVTDNVPVGSVAVPFGRWTNSESGGVNCLTSDRLGDLGNGPTFCDNLVEIDPRTR